MKRDQNDKKENLNCLIGVFFGIGLVIAGVLIIVFSRIDAIEYKNSSDIRTVSAVVEWFDYRTEKEKDGTSTILDFDVKLAFDVDGKKYITKGTIVSGNSAFKQMVNNENPIDIEVYRNSKGEYKIPPDNNPVDFLLSCIAISVGILVILAMVYNVVKRKSEKRKMEEDPKKKK